MKLKSDELVKRNLGSICQDTRHRDLFKGLMRYRRTDLLEYEVLDMLQDHTFHISYQVLSTYLPAIFHGLATRDTILDILHEDRSEFICDYVEGAIYQANQDDQVVYDYHTDAVSNYQIVTNADTTMLSKVLEKVPERTLRDLYEQAIPEVGAYLRTRCKKKSEEYDMYDTSDIVTSTTITRRKMDKSQDYYGT